MMKLKPLVSVLMTAFNRELYIGEAIGSVLASTYNNFELIIVDDCSKDKTVEICNHFACKDNRIRIYVNERNLGDYVNRNRAAAYAIGKYLKFVDSDDRIFPETIERMVAMMESHPESGFGLCDRKCGSDEMYPKLLGKREAYIFHYFKRPIFFASPGLAIFSKKAFDAIGGFPEKRMVGDFEMWHKLALYYPLILMPGNLYWARTHPGQELAEQKKYVLEYEKIKIKYLLADESPLVRNEASLVFRRRRNTVLKIFIQKFLRLEIKESLIRLKVFVFYLQKGKHLISGKSC